MRKLFAIAKMTALEILSEPLTLLVTLSALALTVLAPAFHYHQFGDPTRMARDAGFSALFTCGSAVAIFGAIRSVRREIETGTMQMALAHPVSRTGFLLAKTAGAIAACFVFGFIVSGTLAVIHRGAAIGGVLAKSSGDVARLYGPCFAAGMAVIVLPLVAAAAMNRFGRCRFVLSAMAVAAMLSAAAMAWTASTDASGLLRLAPAAVLVSMPASVMAAVASSCAVALKANAAAAACGAVLALALPAVGNYYLVDALSNGGTLPWTYVGLAALAAAPALAAALLAGINLVNGRDV